MPGSSRTLGADWTRSSGGGGVESLKKHTVWALDGCRVVIVGRRAPPMAVLAWFVSWSQAALLNSSCLLGKHIPLSVPSCYECRSYWHGQHICKQFRRMVSSHGQMFCYHAEDPVECGIDKLGSPSSTSHHS